jgi:hypothetical protein
MPQVTAHARSSSAYDMSRYDMRPSGTRRDAMQRRRRGGANIAQRLGVTGLRARLGVVARCMTAHAWPWWSASRDIVCAAWPGRASPPAARCRIMLQRLPLPSNPRQHLQPQQQASFASSACYNILTISNAFQLKPERSGRYSQ